MAKSEIPLGRIVSISLLPLFLGIAALVSGTGTWIAFFIAILLATLLWFFTRMPRPENETPSNTVSCCHYLGTNWGQHEK